MTVQELKKRFEEQYGAGGEIRVFSAAGRVNLIGEHIDYNGGPVFPAALSLRCAVVARKRSDGLIKLAATTIGDKVTLETDKLDSYRKLPWGAYQAGVAYVMQQAGFTVVGCELLYDADVPFGSGLSSSAAIEVATAATLAAFSAEAGGKSCDGVELAVLSQKAENEYAGVNCGIMDQFASSMGKKNNAILLNCKTLEYKYVPLELGDYCLMIANCNKKRSLVESKYNERRAECEQALKLLQGKIKADCLAEISPEQFEKEKGVLSGKVLDRAEHVVYECDRVLRSVEALKCNDLAAFGRLLNESHESLKTKYEVTGTELDTLSALARGFDGCLGSRMTGAGFGGCTVSLVHKDRAAAFTRFVGAEYEKAIGYPPSFYNTTVEDGAHEIK